MSKCHDRIAYQPLFAGCKHTGERRHAPAEFSKLVKGKSGGKGSKVEWTGFQHSRPKFHGMLLEEVKRCGITIEFGRDVVDYFEDGERRKGGVVLKGGERCEGDLVIAAEGW